MSQLIFKYGTMSSGKSMQLIASAYQYSAQKKKILILKPSIDSRFSYSEIVSRNDLRIKVDYLITNDFNISSISDIFKAECIFVDEAQFLTAEHIDQLKSIAFRVRVICYGLLTDFQSNMFVGSKRLIELADKLEEMSSICHYCNEFARFNMRHINKVPVFEGEVVLLGAEDSYSQTCVKCYFRIKDKRNI